MKKILVIDDDKGILEAVRAILEFDGFEVETTDRSEYIDHMEEPNLPQVILVDFLLSGKDGKNVIKQLKKDSIKSKIPVIMLSAHPEAERAATEAGADDFISKPFEMDDLLKKIKKYI